MWRDSWEVMEALPLAERMEPRVIAMRLLVCIGQARWELGAALAGIIGPGHPLEDREAAGMFYLVRAVILCAAGEMEPARRMVGTLLAVWPEGRVRVLHVPPLAEVCSPANQPAPAATGLSPRRPAFSGRNDQYQAQHSPRL